MSSFPRITVVTISYNQAPFLVECLESVLGQDYPNLEYIVVDPGSTDGSRDILERYRSRLARLVLEPDKGPADGLNKGFSGSTGELLAYLNSDDRLLPGSLDFVQRYFSQHPHVDVVSGTIRIVKKDGRPRLRSMTSDRFDLARYAAGVCLVGQQATFFRRAIFEKSGGFNIANRINWDSELWVDMALAGASFATVRNTLADFRIYDTNITGSSDRFARINAEDDRIREKIKSHGVPTYSPLRAKLMQLATRADIRRHIRWLLAPRPLLPPGWLNSR